MFQKKLWQGHGCHCVTSPSLWTTLSKCLRTLAVDVLQLKFFPILAWDTIAVAQQSGCVHHHVLVFIIWHAFLIGDRSGLQDCQSSTLNVAWHCLAGMSRDVPEKMLSGWCVAPKLLFTFQMCWLPTNIPWNQHRCLLLNIALVKIWTALVLSLKDTTPMISPKKLKHQITARFHYASVHLRWVWAQRGQQHFWMLFIAFALHGRILTCICRC